MQEVVRDEDSEEVAELNASVDHESVVEKVVRYLERKVYTKHGHKTLVQSHCVELHDLFQDV